MTWAPKGADTHNAAPAPAQGAGQHSAAHTAPVQRSAAGVAAPSVPAPAPAPRHGQTTVGGRRRELRAFLAANVALRDLQGYDADPPLDDVPDEQLPNPHAVIRTVANGLRELEPDGAPDASDVALVLTHTCAVASQRSRPIGRLCSNGPNCSNHGDEQRHAIRAAVFGRRAEEQLLASLQGELAARPLALPPVALHMAHPATSAWMPHSALLMQPALYHDTPVTLQR